MLLAIYLISVDCFARDFFSQKQGGGGQFGKKLNGGYRMVLKKIGGRGGSETNKLPFNIVEIIHYFFVAGFLISISLYVIGVYMLNCSKKFVFVCRLEVTR